jgi:hypothetical protein
MPLIHRAFGVPSFSNTEAIAFLTSLFRKTGSLEIEAPKGTRELWLRLADAEKGLSLKLVGQKRPSGTAQPDISSRLQYSQSMTMARVSSSQYLSRACCMARRSDSAISENCMRA